MPEINYVDQSVKFESTETELSLQVSISGIAIAVNTLQGKQLKAFRYYTFRDTILMDDLILKLKELFAKDDLLCLPHILVRVTYLTRQSTLIPNEYYNPLHLKSLLDFNQPLGELDELHTNSVDCVNAQLIFALPSYLVSLFTEKYSNIHFYHQAHSLINFLTNVSKKNSEIQICISLNTEFFDLVIVLEKELLLYNTFPFVSSTDLLYFVLFVLNQMKIKPQYAHFYLTGELSNKKELITVLESQIPKNQIQEITTIKTNKPIPLKEQDSSRFIGIINLIQCE